VEVEQMMERLLAEMDALLKADHEVTMDRMKVHHEEMMTILGADRGENLFATILPNCLHLATCLRICKEM
jgi:hypothetical protein